jgi:hypothetical protein
LEKNTCREWINVDKKGKIRLGSRKLGDRIRLESWKVGKSGMDNIELWRVVINSQLLYSIHSGDYMSVKQLINDE